MSTESHSIQSPAKKKKLVASAGLVVTGLVAGALFSPLGLAGAQETDADTDSNAPGSEARQEADHGRRGGGRLAAAAEAISVDVETVRAGFAEDKTLVEIAAENGVSEEDLVSALVQAASEHLAEAVTAGRITQAEADERAEGIDAKIQERVNQQPSERAGRKKGMGPRAAMDALAEMGLTKEALMEGREAGQTLAETAAANGISEADLVDAMVAAATERAAAAVESGRVTQEQVDERLSNLEDRISDRVNSEPGERRDGRRGGPRHPDRPEVDTPGPDA